jgi:hypothetical protein
MASAAGSPSGWQRKGRGWSSTDAVPRRSSRWRRRCGRPAETRWRLPPTSGTRRMWNAVRRDAAGVRRNRGPRQQRGVRVGVRISVAAFPRDGRDPLGRGHPHELEERLPLLPSGGPVHGRPSSTGDHHLDQFLRRRPRAPDDGGLRCQQGRPGGAHAGHGRRPRVFRNPRQRRGAGRDPHRGARVVRCGGEGEARTGGAAGADRLPGGCRRGGGVSWPPTTRAISAGRSSTSTAACWRSFGPRRWTPRCRRPWRPGCASNGLPRVPSEDQD